MLLALLTALRHGTCFARLHIVWAQRRIPGLPPHHWHQQQKEENKGNFLMYKIGTLQQQLTSRSTHDKHLSLQPLQLYVQDVLAR